MKKLLIFLLFIQPIFPHPGDSSRPVAAPFISGDDFRSFCKFIFDPPFPAIATTAVNFAQAITFNPQAVQDGDTIFVNLFYLEPFFKFFHPRITAKYILVTHNGDDSVTENYRKYLDDQQLAYWFTQNSQIQHERLINLPIGIPLRCLRNNNKIHLQVKDLQHKIKKNLIKSQLLYGNINPITNPEVREPVIKYLSGLSFCQISPTKSFYNYLEDLAHSKFTASPEGKGPDCHRTWEALYMACIPIVKSSVLDPLYENLPVLIINKWEDTTQEFLEKKYHEMINKNYNFNKLYIKYWLDLIKKYQDKVRENSLVEFVNVG